jgi:hypothetical protein
VGRHHDAGELSWVRRWVWGLRNQAFEQAAGTHQCAVKLLGDPGVGSGGGIDGP